MTSSLVGSEMCIRDRSMAVGGQWDLDRKAAAGYEVPDVCPLCDQVGFGSLWHLLLECPGHPEEKPACLDTLLAGQGPAQQKALVE
eukprot:7756511-Prorocentrum_lima.AAC.1